MMGLQEIVSWYQRKIGTYDKQQWEHTIEQRILHGLTHVPKKTAKLKTDLIDVDLVRGSSFPKAKPKHGLMTIMRLSVARLILLPFYGHWWVQQTSCRVFALLLLLYCLQLVNMALFFWGTWYMNEEILDNVFASEVLVPSAMMLVLSFLHSQIVAPHSVPASRDLLSCKSRRLKRTKRRTAVSSRSRSLGSDSKSSPDTGSDKTCGVKDSISKYKRVRLRKGSSEDVKVRNVVWEPEQQIASPSDETVEPEAVLAASVNRVTGSVNRQRVRLQVGLDAQSDSAAQDAAGAIAVGAREATPLDDDGFESLNGNGSSENGEDLADDAGSLDDIDPQKKSIEENCDVLASGDDVHSQTLISNSVISSTEPSSDEPTKSPIRNSPSSTQFPSSSVTALVSVPNCSKEKLEMPSILPVSQSDSLEEQCVLPVVGNCEEAQMAHSSSSVALSSPAVETQDRDKWVQEILTSRKASVDSESEASAENEPALLPQPRDRPGIRRRGSQVPSSKGKIGAVDHESSYNSSCESEDAGNHSSPGTGGSCPALTEATTSAAEWIGITTNSEECSYSSEPDESDSQREFAAANGVELNDHPFAWEFELSPTILLNPSCAASDKVSCTIWEKRDPKKADLSVLDISSSIIARVESMPENMDYFYAGVVMAVIIAVLPSICRLVRSDTSIEGTSTAADIPLLVTLMPGSYLFTSILNSLVVFVQSSFGHNILERIIILIALFERAMLAGIFFFLLAVAERTFKQRFLYAKLFSHLTSFRRARKSDLPHFRLNKVRNIKTWLSVRSYLKRRGPQRSVDVIVSAAFLITLLLLSFLSVECLKDSVRLHSEYNLEALAWCLALGVFLLRFMTLGTKINRKYRNLSVLITEQINLYLQIEQKPNKKEELMVANSVLKLAADLLKELESPFKISGLSANPYLYTITKVVILSALSGVLSEMLGFKLKLHKIKINTGV